MQRQRCPGIPHGLSAVRTRIVTAAARISRVPVATRCPAMGQRPGSRFAESDTLFRSVGSGTHGWSGDGYDRRDGRRFRMTAAWRPHLHFPDVLPRVATGPRFDRHRPLRSRAPPTWSGPSPHYPVPSSRLTQVHREEAEHAGLRKGGQAEVARQFGPGLPLLQGPFRCTGRKADPWPRACSTFPATANPRSTGRRCCEATSGYGSPPGTRFT